jgi:hypothetical protein
MFFAFILIYKNSLCQNLSTTKEAQLQTIIYNFFYHSRTESVMLANNRSGANSEAIICLLKIDSTGTVKSVHLLSEENNRDSAYEILKALNPLHFKSWKEEKCAGKTIVIPIFLDTGTNVPMYINDIMGYQLFKRGETENVIVIKGIVFGWPTIKG